MPPRRYRELYRRESKKQADISGYNISQTKLDGPLGWRVHSEIDGRQTDADITVLYWADLVQDSMRAGLVQGFYLLLRTAWIYLSSGALRRLMLLRKGPVIAALYPVVMMLFQLFVAIVAGVLALAAFQGLVGLISGIAIYLAVLIGFYRLDNRLFAYYLMYDYAFSSGENGATPQVLVTRMAQFRRDIEQGLDSEADEVLVVGHSSGAHLGISIIADILRSGHPKAEKLAFLSLGQVVPMVSFLPLARELRSCLSFNPGTNRLG